MSPDSPLSGYAVVELSTGIAGAYCTKLLADGGAESSRSSRPRATRCAVVGFGRRPSPTGRRAALHPPGGPKQSILARPDEAGLGTCTVLLACSRERRRRLVARVTPLLIIPRSRPRNCGRPSPSDRHRDHAVWARRALAGPGGDGVHARRRGRGRSSGPVGEGPNARPCPSAARSGRGSAGAFAAVGTMASHLRTARGGERGTRRRLRARGACCASPSTRRRSAT